MTDENKTGEEVTKSPGRMKKAVYHITGISDIQFMWKSLRESISLLNERASFVKKQIKNLEAPDEKSASNQSFEDVVKKSSIPLEQHLAKAGKYKKYWLCCFFIAVFVALFLIAGCVKLIVNTEYNVSLLKVTLTLGLMFAVCIYSFVKAMTYEFLGWQLRNEAHSEEEFGTLRHFINDNGVRNTFNFEQAGQIRGRMNKSRNSLVALLPLSLFITPAYSADLGIDSITEAAKRSGDLSRQMLHTVFGEVVNNPFSPSGDGLLNNVFFTVNEVIAILALIYMAIISIKKLHQAGQLGKFIEGDGNNAFNFVKTTFGWLLLVPTVVGWSVAQLLFLWCGSIIGVGSANVIADKTASELASGKAVYITPVMPEMASVAKGMFEMNLCALGVNQGLAQMEASGQHYESNSQMKFNTGDSSYSISVDNGSAVCGTVKLPQKPTGWTSVFSSGYADSVYAVQQQATDSLWSKMKNTAEQFNSAYMSKMRSGDGQLPDVETAIQTAARDYQQQVQQAADNAAGSNDMLQKMESDIKEKGWLYLGIYYHTLATANTELKDVANLKPIVSGISGDGDVGSTDYYKGLFQCISFTTEKQYLHSPFRYC